MYYLEIDPARPYIVYLYEEGDLYKRYKATFTNDIELAKRVLDILNNGPQKLIESNKE